MAVKSATFDSKRRTAPRNRGGAACCARRALVPRAQHGSRDIAAVAFSLIGVVSRLRQDRSGRRKTRARSTAIYGRHETSRVGVASPPAPASSRCNRPLGVVVAAAVSYCRRVDGHFLGLRGAAGC